MTAASTAKKMAWYHLGLMSFTIVWSFSNVVNNYANQGLAVIFSWIFIFALFFIPYALMTGEMGATFQDAKGGVSSWISKTSPAKHAGLFAFFAGWIYWIVQIPYLAQKPQMFLVAMGWAFLQNASLTTMFSTMGLQLSILVLFIFFVWIASRGVYALRIISNIAGLASVLMSALYILLMIAAPALRGATVATTSYGLMDFIPNFDFAYMTTLAMLVFAVGGAEKISPYVRDTKNPAVNFPRGMIFLAIMVSLSAFLGSFALSMMFNSTHIPKDLRMNGQYYAFAQLGVHYGLGNLLLIIYAISVALAQAAVLAISVDAPLRIFLMDADARYVPSFLRKVNKRGLPVNGYLLTVGLVSLLIVVPAFGVADMNALYNLMLDLNAVVMPMRYFLVFIAYFLLKSAANQQKYDTPYYFVRNPLLGRFVALWCVCFTSFACVMGMFPKSSTPVYSVFWYFEFALNIFTPFILIGLGFFFIFLARREYRLAFTTP